MSEMKTYDVIMTPSDNGPWVLKSAADKVISKQKYKRCLAMALLSLEKRETYKAEYEEWCLKWYQRWLELADKFREQK